MYMYSFSEIQYYLSYYMIKFGMNISSVINSMYNSFITEKFKKSIYKIEIIDVKDNYIKTVYKRPFYDILFSINGLFLKSFFNIDISKYYCVQHIPPQILIKYSGNDVFYNIVSWDNDNRLIKRCEEIYKKHHHKYIIVMIQCPIKIDITYFVNNNINIFDKKNNIKLSEMLLIMYYLDYIDIKTLICLLCKIEDIVISTMDKELHEVIIRGNHIVSF